VAPKKKAEPKVPMRPLHWSKVPDAKAVDTMWFVMDESSAPVEFDALEAAFGLAQMRERSATAEHVAAGGGGATPRDKKPRKEEVQLIDMKRSNNISIALARIRLTDEQIKQAIMDPVSHPLTSEQLNSLLSVLPTGEELESIRDYTGEVESLGRVEKFFCVLQDVERLGPRLQAMQAKEQFMPQYETLSEEFKTILTAIEQVRTSSALQKVLTTVLAIGNYLNGTSARGGAYGFKLADLGKLVQVKSGDSKTTLLHYLASIIAKADPSCIDRLKDDLNSLPEAKDIPLAEKQAELAKLAQSFKLCQTQQGLGSPSDPLTGCLRVDAPRRYERCSQSSRSASPSSALLRLHAMSHFLPTTMASAS